MKGGGLPGNREAYRESSPCARIATKRHAAAPLTPRGLHPAPNAPCRSATRWYKFMDSRRVPHTLVK